MTAICPSPSPSCSGDYTLGEPFCPRLLGTEQQRTDGHLDHTTKFLTPKSAKKREQETFLRCIFLTRTLGLRISLTICSGTSQLESIIHTFYSANKSAPYEEGKQFSSSISVLKKGQRLEEQIFVTTTRNRDALYVNYPALNKQLQELLFNLHSSAQHDCLHT